MEEEEEERLCIAMPMNVLLREREGVVSVVCTEDRDCTYKYPIYNSKS